MKTSALAVILLAVLLQGCAVNVIVAPNAVFTGGDAHGDSIESQNNGRVNNNVLASFSEEE